MPPDPQDRRLAPRRKPATGPVEDYEPPEDGDPDGPSQADIDRFSDVTVKCPECGTELFDDVAICWNCGRPVGSGAPGEGKLPLWVIIVALLLIAGMVGFLFNLF